MTPRRSAIDIWNWLGALLSVGFPALVYFAATGSPAGAGVVLILIIWLRKKIAFGMRPVLGLSSAFLLALLALGKTTCSLSSCIRCCQRGAPRDLRGQPVVPATVAERIARVGYPDLRRKS